MPGDRFRVTVTDNNDGVTASIAYYHIDSSCPNVVDCTGTLLRPLPGDPPILSPYPFRVDASLRDQGATLADVQIVRIK